MQAGRLRHRVSFRKFIEVSDGHDGFTQDGPISVRRRIPAEVVALQGRELWNARQIDQRAEFQVTVRYWQTHHEDLNGGRVEAIWHDGRHDRTLHVVAPPRELVPRVMLVMMAKEAA